MTTFYNDMIEEVCVMLVDNDEEFLTRMADLLKSCDYKVMMVDKASITASILSKGKQKIDVMILNVHSMDQLSFDLLAQAVALGIISIAVCDESDKLAAKKALDEGAYLFLEKPFNEEIIKYLWQFVVTKKLQSERVRKESEENRGWMNVEGFGDNVIVGANEEQFGKNKSMSNTGKQRNDIQGAEVDLVLDEKYKLRKKRDRKEKKETNDEESQSCATNKVVGQKDYIKWTESLHAKFMEAVELLGEGKCYPKEIVEVMNVPGLTRTHVASHLQKCRRNNWRSPEERKYIRHSSNRESESGSPGSNIRKFGTMPCLQKNEPNLQHNTFQTQRGPQFSFSTLSTNNIFGRGDSLIQQPLFHQQLQVQPYSLSNNNLFNNPLYSIPSNNIGGGPQQQHEPWFGMSSSQRPQGPIIGSTSYRLGQALNGGDHHTQGGYNLNFDVAQGASTYSNATVNNGNNLNINVGNVTTYSSSPMMSNTYDVANFQQYVTEPNMSNPSNIVATSYEFDGEDSWTSE